MVRDREAGRYTDPEKVHAIDYEGEHFSVPGPHSCEPSPQRTPVLYQAGSSERGREFAANNAEALFVSQPTEAAVASYVEDVRARADAAGRNGDDLAFFAGIAPIVGETEEVAQAKYEKYRENVDTEATLTLLGGFMDLDFSELDPDQRVEHIETDAMQGAVNALTKHAPERDWTVRDVAEFCGLGSTSPVVVGSPESVADELERWHAETGVTGFNLKEIVRPGTLRDFVELVVPELRERGLAREEYEGGTLRENMLGRRYLADDHPAKR